MSAILCIAAMHLTTLRPHVSKYAQAALQIMSKSLRLFRESLSQPFTKSNCDALLGTAVLVTYMSWCELGFLGEQRAAAKPRLDLSRDYLLLLSPGVVEVWLQAMPILINEGSVFLSATYQHPRLNIEAAVASRGQDPARFVQPLMKMWNDPRYQTSAGLQLADKKAVPTTMPRAWHLLAGLEARLPPDSFHPSVLSRPEGEECQLVIQALKNTLASIDSTRAVTTTSHPQSATAEEPPRTGACVSANPHIAQLEHKAFQSMVCKLSPLLCCISPPSALLNPSTSLEADIERLIFALPILCCGPVANLAMKGDSRVLVVLFHLYHAYLHTT